MMRFSRRSNEMFAQGHVWREKHPFVIAIVAAIVRMEQQGGLSLPLMTQK